MKLHLKKKKTTKNVIYKKNKIPFLPQGKLSFLVQIPMLKSIKRCITL